MFLLGRARPRRTPTPRRAQLQPAPPPTGGLDTVTPVQGMDATVCPFLFNMIPYQYGLRVRSGFREWATNVGPNAGKPGLYNYGSPFTFNFAAPLGGLDENQWYDNNPVGVRTLLGFTGCIANGSNDRLWAVTDEGIWDVSNITSTPTNVFPFDYVGLPDGPVDAGRGVGTGFVSTSGAHYHLYCDGYHGYLRYSEDAKTWDQAVGITYAQATGGGALPPFEIHAASQLFEDVYGQPDPAKFRFVTQWKNRLWFVQDDSATAWYLEIGAFSGAAFPMPFAPRFKNGGELVGLWSWTVDGGTGIDDHLVAISRGGDLVIYSGTDPNLPGAFTMRGVWWVGRPPPGRRIASQFGGDLFILSTLGCVPLSKLVAGGMIRDPNLMATARVANIFNKLMTERGTYQGWGIALHPTDNLMVISVPAIPGSDSLQLVMSLANLGWAVHSGLPMECMETWRNKLYFGTQDGRVCVNDMAMDGIGIDGTGMRPIEWGCITSYQNYGTTNKKRVNLLRAYFITDGSIPGVRLKAKFDFDVEPSTTIPAIPRAHTAWGYAKWGQSVWGHGVGTHTAQNGATGIGTFVAVELRGASMTSTTLTGFELLGEEAGVM